MAIDSMPLEVCKNSRAKRSFIFKEVNYANPKHGYCAAMYISMDINWSVFARRVFQSFDTTPAFVYDIHYLKDVKEHISNATLIIDKGYLSADLQLDLFQNYKIKIP